jgi:predicted double-glycine peptidase
MSSPARTRLSCCPWLALLSAATTAAGCASPAQRPVRSYFALRFEQVDRQISEYTCGLAALTTALNRYYQVPVAQQSMAEAYLPEVAKAKRGLTFLDLKTIAADHGFEAFGYRLDTESLDAFLEKTPVPLIAHVETSSGIYSVGHFVLVLGRHRGFWIIGDPAFGTTYLTDHQFRSRWTGYVLVVLPDPAHRDLTPLAARALEQGRQRARIAIGRLDGSIAQAP